MNSELRSQVQTPILPSEPRMDLYPIPTKGGSEADGLSVYGSRDPLVGLSDVISISPCLFVLTRNCPKGFTCCDNECCPERKVWDPANDPFRSIVIGAWVILSLVSICVLVRHCCLKCRELQHEVRTADHQTPQELPSIAPLESIWVTSLDPPPPYSQVVLMPTPPEPPPPYSLRPEGHANQMRGTACATL